MALIRCLNYVYPILIRDLNVYLSQPKGRERDKELVVMLVLERLKDMAYHFRPCWER